MLWIHLNSGGECEAIFFRAKFPQSSFFSIRKVWPRVNISSNMVASYGYTIAYHLWWCNKCERCDVYILITPHISASDIHFPWAHLLVCNQAAFKGQWLTTPAIYYTHYPSCRYWQFLIGCSVSLRNVTQLISFMSTQGAARRKKLLSFEDRSSEVITQKHVNISVIFTNLHTWN